MSNILAFKNVLLPETQIKSNYERVGIGGFIFYASVNETSSKTATITSNPVEDGSNLDDHIIKNPTTISIEGEVSDTWVETVSSPSLLQEVFPPIGIVSAYLPSRTLTQISKINGIISDVNDFIDQANQAIETGEKLYNYFTGVEADTTITSKFLEFFDTIFESKSTFSLECTDRVYTNMAINSLSITKLSNDSYSFSLSAQKITEAQTTLIQLVKNADGDAKAQGANVSDKGTQQTKEVDQSFASSLLGVL